LNGTAGFNGPNASALGPFFVVAWLMPFLPRGKYRRRRRGCHLTDWKKTSTESGPRRWLAL